MRYLDYTNKGPRLNNEDSFFVRKDNNLIYACVADGVGGVKYGEIASHFAATEFEKYISEKQHQSLEDFITQLNNGIQELAKTKLKVDYIATTFTAGIISDQKIKGIHVGDSRISVIRENYIYHLTEDHSGKGRIIKERLVKNDDTSSYPHRNILELVLGNPGFFKYQLFEFDLISGDRIIFSTDGFHNSIPDQDIIDICIKYKSLQEVYRHLVIEIENRILSDNATFICIGI